MNAAVAELEPQLVWGHFLALTQIARPSKHEDEARGHVLSWAAEHGFETAVDAGGNTVVRVPASRGRENAPAVVLQAHLDIVCERDPDSPNDPRAGRIEVVRDDDWVTAVGTTLGADNGIGVAGAMAAATDPQVSHGPLELLFTVSEEEGLEGAKMLDPRLVGGRILLNLDGSSDGAITVGCAGSTHTFTRLGYGAEPIPSDHATFVVWLSGVRGGHSGGDIAKGRVNAIKALGRALSHALEAVPLRLVSLEGGASRNAIPREAQAIVATPTESEGTLRDAVDTELAALRNQYADSDDGVSVAVQATEGAATTWDETSTRRALDLVRALPTGVIAMNPRLPGSVETSTSVTVAESADGVLTLASMTRSADADALDDVLGTIQAAARLAGADVDAVRSYPPWRPDLDSPLLARACETFRRVLDSEPKLEVVHGGLECAVIGSKLPGVEMIAIGPEVEGQHAPGERLGITATQRFYRLLGALLDDLSA